MSHPPSREEHCLNMLIWRIESTEKKMSERAGNTADCWRSCRGSTDMHFWPMGTSISVQVCLVLTLHFRAMLQITVNIWFHPFFPYVSLLHNTLLCFYFNPLFLLMSIQIMFIVLKFTVHALWRFLLTHSSYISKQKKKISTPLFYIQWGIQDRKKEGIFRYFAWCWGHDFKP